MLLAPEQVRKEYRISQKQVSDVLSSLSNECIDPESCAITNQLLVNYYEKLLLTSPWALFFKLSINMCIKADPEQTKHNLDHFNHIVPLFLTYKAVGYEDLLSLEESQLIDGTYMFIIKIFSKAITIKEQHIEFEVEFKELLRSAALLYVASLEIERTIPEGRLEYIVQIANQLVTDYTESNNPGAVTNDPKRLVNAVDQNIQYKELLRRGWKAA